MLRAVLFLLLATLAGTRLRAADPDRVYGERPGAVARARERVKAGDPAVKPALDALLSDAKKALKLTPPTVMDKPRTPASGDKHDYMSQAPYFWPDPAKPGGLPYLRRDGDRNPEAGGENSDAPRFGRMGSAARTLALAAFLTDRPEFSDHAAKLLRTWFLDPATRMNPNFQFAQAVPGVNTGRGTGMIESRTLTAVMAAAALLHGSPAWPDADDATLKKWLAAFLDWARTSPQGREEAAAENNHGTWYDVQVAHLALFTGQEKIAREIIEGARDRRLPRQIKPDGTQPLELTRADSFGYSRFNLTAWFDLSTLADHLHLDLWHHQPEKSGSLQAAFDFLLTFAEAPAKPWPYGKKKPSRTLSPLLWPAAAQFPSDRHRRALESSKDWKAETAALFFEMK